MLFPFMEEQPLFQADAPGVCVQEAEPATGPSVSSRLISVGGGTGEIHKLIITRELLKSTEV